MSMYGDIFTVNPGFFKYSQQKLVQMFNKYNLINQ